MNIVVNDIAASQTGALTILKSFYDFVVLYGQKHQWIFLLGAPYLEEKPHIRIIVLDRVKKSWVRRLSFDLLTGKNYIKGLEPDLVFSLQNTITFGLRKAQVLYVHQPLGYQSVKRFSLFEKREREYAVYQKFIGRMIDYSVKKAAFTIVQTEWMKKAVIEKTGIASDRIRSILPDDGRSLKLSQAKKKTSVFLRNRFFFPSGDMIYKNHACILEACKLLNQKGIDDFEVLFTLERLSSVTGDMYQEEQNNVVCIGKISHEAVEGYYQDRTLIFPSYIETLGLPLVEARRAGTLILAADTPFGREILEGYPNVRFFPPFSPDSLADCMEEVICGRIQVKEVLETEETKVAEAVSSWAKVLEILENTAARIGHR